MNHKKPSKLKTKPKKIFKPKKKIGLKGFSIGFAGFLACLALFWILGIKAIANHYIVNQTDIPIHIQRLIINPLSGQITTSLIGIKEFQDKLTVNQIKVNLGILALLKKTLFIESFSVRGVDVQKDQYKVQLGGLTIPNSMSVQLLEEGKKKVLFEGRINIKQALLESLEKEKFLAQTDLNIKVEDLIVLISSDSKAQPEFSVKKVEIGDESFVEALYKEFEPHFELDVVPLEASFSELDSSKPNQITKFNFYAKLGEEDEILVRGGITPLAPVIDGNVSAKIKKLSLHPYSALSEKFIGYRLKTGVLNVDTEAEIVKGQLDVKNDLLVQKLKLDRLKKDEKDELTNQLGMPLNTLLSILRQKNGDIELSVPVKGDLTDPSVGVGDVLKTVAAKASKMALRKTVETAMPLLKTARIAGAVAGFALKTRFEDVVFLPGKFDLSEQNKTILNEVGETLKEKTDIRVSVCGLVVPSDLKKMKRKKEEEHLKLGDSRSKAVQAYLMENFGIESDQLFLCTTKIEDKEENLPRVEISL